MATSALHEATSKSPRGADRSVLDVMKQPLGTNLRHVRAAVAIDSDEKGLADPLLFPAELFGGQLPDGGFSHELGGSFLKVSLVGL